jgi:hypothetical protein
MFYQQREGKSRSGILLLCFFVLFFLIQGNAESNTFPIGTVLGIGQAELESMPGKMTTLDTNTYPLFPDSRLRTRDGRISVTLRDGCRIEAYKNSELSIRGGKETYWIDLERGSIAFSFPFTSSVTIITPSATIETGPSALIKRVDYTKEGNLKGVILIDEKSNTQVISISGEIVVRDSRGNLQILASGKGLYISADPYKIIPAQAIEDTKGIPEKGGVPAKVSRDEVIVPYLIGGGTAVVTTAVIIETERKRERVASPAVP